MTQPAAPRVLGIALLACLLATGAAAQAALPAEGDPLSAAPEGFQPLWADDLPPARGPFSIKRAPGASPSMSFPADAAWEGFRTPGISRAFSHYVTEWQGKLVLAVSVYAAGHIACDGIVVWDGTKFEALPDAGGVQDLTTWNGQLVVTVPGPFPNYQNHSIKRFNGISWDLLGVTDHYPSCMTEFDGKLVVGGQFSSVSGVPATRIASYDGIGWSAMGSGLGGSGPECLTVHAGELYAGDSALPTSAIAAWNGALGVWEPRTGVVTGTVRGLASDGVNLYATGQSLVGGGVTLGGLGRWDGAQWNAITGAVGRSGQDVAHWDGKIISTISTAPGRLSQTDGLSLTAVPGDSLGFGESFTSVFHLGRWGTRLVATGGFVNNGSVSMPNVAILDGSQWSTPSVPWDASMRSPNWSIQSMLNWNGKLVVAGGGGLVADQDHYVRAAGAAVFDGEHWAPLSPNFFSAQYRLLATWNGDLVVGGYSLSILGTPIQRMARWDGTTWHPLGTNAPDYVSAMQEFQGDLYVTEDAGLFNGVARWNGTTWQAAGAGVGGGAWALGVHGDSLVVGGSLSMAGGAPAAGIAVWDGAAWHPLGDGLSGGPVDAVGSWNGFIVAGGRFTSSGAQSLDGAAYYDGSAWHQMGGNVMQLYYVREYYGELFASGVFRLPDDTEILTLAKWTGTDWQLLGSGTNESEFAFFGDHLYGAGSGRVHGQVSHGLSRVPISAVLDAPRPRPHDPSIKLVASPNPAAGPVTLRFTLAFAGHVRLTMHDLAGRQVATVLDGPADAGEHTARWSAPAPPGVYFSRLELPDGKVHVMRVVRLDSRR